MRYTSLYALALPLLASALPLEKRTASATDLLVLQFAFVLEQLETQFYAEAIKTFQASDFLSAGFTSAEVAVEQITIIQGDEATHTSLLGQTILDQGGVPLTSCQFNFDSVLTSLSTTMATARLVELVGVGAYLGAAALISDPTLLTAAGSILTVEARHQTILNLMSGGGVAIPNAFDLPLSPQQVLGIAGPFISGCSLGITPNLPLAVTNTETISVGTSLSFDMSPLNGKFDASSLSCQMLVGGSSFAIVQPMSNCIVPKISGPVAIFITNDPQPLLNSQLNQFSSSIMLGPTIAFIDSETQTLPQLVRSGGGSADSSNVVSPAEASSIVEGAQSTGSVAEPTGSGSESEGEASATASASSSEPTGSAEGANIAEQQPGGPNFAVGRSGDGHTIVQGWKNLPPGITPP